MTDNQTNNNEHLPGSTGYLLIGETPSFLYDTRSFIESRKSKHGPVFRSNLFNNSRTIVSLSHAYTSSIISSSPENVSAASVYAQYLYPMFPSSYEWNDNLLFQREDVSKRLEQRKFLLDLLYNPIHNVNIEFNNISQVKIGYEYFKRIVEQAWYEYIFSIKLTNVELDQLTTLTKHQINSVMSSSASANSLYTKEKEKEFIQLIKTMLSKNRKGTFYNVDMSLLLILCSSIIIKCLTSWVFLSIVHCNNSQPQHIEAVMLECLRMYSPIQGIIRDLKTYDDNGDSSHAKKICKDWRVWISLFDSNRDEKVFQNASTFNSHRFHPSNHELNRNSASKEKCPFHKSHDADSNEMEQASTAEAVDKLGATILSFGKGDRKCPGRFIAWRIAKNIVSEFVKKHEYEVNINVNQNNIDRYLKYFPVIRLNDKVHLKSVKPKKKY